MWYLKMEGGRAPPSDLCPAPGCSSALGALSWGGGVATVSPYCPGMVWGECHLDKVRDVSSVTHCHHQRAAASQIFAPFLVQSGSQYPSRSVPAAFGLFFQAGGGWR